MYVTKDNLIETIDQYDFHSLNDVILLAVDLSDKYDMDVQMLMIMCVLAHVALQKSKEQ